MADLNARADTDYRVTIEQIGRLERGLLSVRESDSGSAESVNAIALIQYREIARLRSELDAAMGFDAKEARAPTGFDLVSVRPLAAESNNGSMPLDAGRRLVEQSRNMMLAAACATLSPRRAFRFRDHPQARQYVAGARIEQSAAGGFAVNLLSPAVQRENGSKPTIDRFSRFTMTRLVSGLRALRESADLAKEIGGGANGGLFAERVDDGVSANLCDAVGKMVGRRKPIGLEISVSWALARPVHGGRASVHFGKTDAPILLGAAGFLRESATDKSLLP